MLQFQKYIEEELKINYVEFDNILLSNSQEYLIAGSTALYYYYIQEGIIPGFEPNDLDIFISTDHISYKNNKMIKLINESGYIIKKDESTEPYFNYFIKTGHINWRYYFSFINVVTYYNEKTTKKIQIINIRLKKDKYYLIDFIKCSFDLSVCITWFDIKQKKFQTLDKNLTDQKIMFIANRDTYKFDERIKKYIDRGFKRIDYIIFDSDKRLYRDITNIIKKYIPNQISETNSFINEYRIREILSKIYNIIYYQKNFNSLKELLTNLEKYNFDYIIKSLQEEPSFEEIIDILLNPEYYQKYIQKYF